MSVWVWIYEYMSIWVCEYVSTWVYEYMSMSIWVYEYVSEEECISEREYVYLHSNRMYVCDPFRNTNMWGSFGHRSERQRSSRTIFNQKETRYGLGMYYITYIHTHIHTYIHTRIHTYIHMSVVVSIFTFSLSLCCVVGKALGAKVQAWLLCQTRRSTRAH